MSDISYKDKGSILGPFKSLSFFSRKPVTEPFEPRIAADNYRGFHVNDWDVCIGCSTCQKVCDNAAITMIKIPGLPDDPVMGIRNDVKMKVKMRDYTMPLNLFLNSLSN